VEQIELPGLTPSSKTVIAVVSRMKISTLKEIAREAQLPVRTTQLAIKKLLDLKLISVRICLSDTRRKFYCFSKSMD